MSLSASTFMHRQIAIGICLVLSVPTLVADGIAIIAASAFWLLPLPMLI